MTTFKNFLKSFLPHDASDIAPQFHTICDWDIDDPLWHYGYFDIDTATILSSTERGENDQRKSSREVIQFLHKAEWAKLPDRSKSVFFSTTTNAHPLIKREAQLFAAYPLKNQPIAVLNHQDFNAKTIELAGFRVRLRHLMTMLRTFGFIMQGSWDRLDTDESISNMYELLKSTSRDEYARMLDENRRYVKSNYYEFIVLPNYFDEFKKRMLAGWSPSDLGITLQNTSNFRAPEKTSEVWMEGKYILVPKYALKSFIKQVKAA